MRLCAAIFGLEVWLVGNCAVLAQPLIFSTETVGGPNSDAVAELFQPRGAGPFPAIVVLPGCNGVGPHYRGWGRQLADWGYLASLVDSFRPRRVSTVCNHGMMIPPRQQAADAFDAAAYLRTHPDVRRDRIAAIGFSHGGWAVLKAVLAGLARPPQMPAFAAAVAFYPGCDPPLAARDGCFDPHRRGR